MSPLKDSQGSIGGVVSFRDGEHNIIGMGCRIKYNDTTVLMTADHVLDALREIESLYIEHKGRRIPFDLKKIKMRLRSAENHRDIVLFEIDNSMWSVLGVSARRVIYSDVPCPIYIYGYNEDSDFSCSRGQLSPTSMAYRVEHTASTLPGWSGTPIFDVQGSVVGMHCGWRPLQGVNYGVVGFWYNLSNESGDRKNKHAWRHRERDFDDEDQYDEFDVEIYAEEKSFYKVKSNDREIYALLSDTNPNSWANQMNIDLERGPIFKDPQDSKENVLVLPTQSILGTDVTVELTTPDVVTKDEIRKMIGDSLKTFVAENMRPVQDIPPVAVKAAKAAKIPVVVPKPARPAAEKLVLTKDSLKAVIMECLKSSDFQKGSPTSSVVPPKKKTKTVSGSPPSLSGDKQKRKRSRKSKSTVPISASVEKLISSTTENPQNPHPATSLVLNNLEYTLKVPQSGSFPKGPSPMSENPWRCTSHASTLLFHLVQKLSPQQLGDYLRITRSPDHHSLCQAFKPGQSLMMNLCIVYSILFVTDESREMLIQAILGELLTNINREFIWNNENFSLMRVLSEFGPCAHGIVELINPLPRSWFVEA